MPSDRPARGLRDCARVKSRSNRPDTSRCTTRERSRRCHKAKSIGRVPAYRLRTLLPARFVIRQGLRRSVSPGIKLVFDASTRRPFPLGFGWQAISPAAAMAEPLAIFRRLKPGNRDHRLFRMVEGRILTKRRCRISRGAHEVSVRGIGYGAGRQPKFVHPHAMNGTLVVLPGFDPIANQPSGIGTSSGSTWVGRGDGLGKEGMWLQSKGLCSNVPACTKAKSNAAGEGARPTRFRLLGKSVPS